MSFYRNSQPFQVDDAIRVITTDIKDAHIAAQDLDVRVNMNTMDINALKNKIDDLDSSSAFNTLLETRDFTRTSVPVNIREEQFGTEDIAFHCTIDGSLQGISVAEIIKTFRALESKIQYLEEKIQEFEFYNEGAA